MTEAEPKRSRGRPKKDPNAPKPRYFLSPAEKPGRQSQTRLRAAKTRDTNIKKIPKKKNRH